MQIRITSDSTCDLSRELIEKYNITVTPLTVTMGSESFPDGVDFDPDRMFGYVAETGQLPKTSAVNIGDYCEVFGELVGNGFEVIHFSLSSDMSSAYQNACIAASEVGHVHVIDSKNLSTGQGLLVMHAARRAQEGADAETICNECLELVPRVEASFIIDRLDYLYKGGRCSALSALGANLMKLKPCIGVKDGRMSPEKKYRGPFEKVILTNSRRPTDYESVALPAALQKQTLFQTRGIL